VKSRIAFALSILSTAAMLYLTLKTGIGMVA